MHGYHITSFISSNKINWNHIKSYLRVIVMLSRDYSSLEVGYAFLVDMTDDHMVLKLRCAEV